MPLGERAGEDLPADDQIALVRTLLPTARRHGARLTVHGEPRWPKPAGPTGCICPPAAIPPAAAPSWDRLAHRVSIHTVTEAEAIDPDAVDYASQAGL